MKEVLIASFDMEVGGVERSLINMLNCFDYDKNKVDLMLYSHTGDFLRMIPEKVNLLQENKKYASFRKSIATILKTGEFLLGYNRLKARRNSVKLGEKLHLKEASYVQMQLMWKYSLKYLPSMDKEYDVAISYLWPHYFVAEKVKAKVKIAWIHTDYSKLDTYIEEDLNIWNKFNHIIAVSEGCRSAFVEKYPSLSKKVLVIENIIESKLIKKMAEENEENEINQCDGFKVVTVARLSPAKGIDKAIEALKILRDERNIKNIKWFVVGYGGEEENIKRLIKEYHLEDSFILLGKKLNPYPYIKASDLYVQPSRYEGRAVTVVEAQILGKTVIITNYPTAQSQLKDGYDGIICGLTPLNIAKEIENNYINLQIKKGIESNCRNSNYDDMENIDILYKLF